MCVSAASRQDRSRTAALQVRRRDSQPTVFVEASLPAHLSADRDKEPLTLDGRRGHQTQSCLLAIIINTTQQKDYRVSL